MPDFPNQQGKVIEELRRERSLKNRLVDWLIGAVIGFFISKLLSFLFGL
ncbi:MAG: hypothetical protein QXY40_08290 [Candidatus Methanomethylicia archaeon]